MSISAIIVDDEPNARIILKAMLGDADVAINLLGEAGNVKEAVRLIQETKPQVVFLDVDMPGLSGLELADFFEKDRNFDIIFTTAHQEHAVKAFRVNALDYLLKPIDPRELDQALIRLQTHLLGSDSVNMADENRIALPMSNGLELVEVSTISAFQADGSYTKIHIHNADTKLVSKKLKLFDDLLSSRPRFKRIHRSYIVNLDSIERYAKAESMLILSGGIEVPVSKDHRLWLDEYMAKLRP